MSLQRDLLWGAWPTDSLLLLPPRSYCSIDAPSDGAWQGSQDWTLFTQQDFFNGKLRDHSLAWPKFSHNCEVV